ncbi:hypothetical protein HN803_08025 [candidate division WWE3 bacterium]|jgi:hypothetical protein|nr:hypothetical protein [candidate division WWE3 bacterium]MBT7350700.1 hypothetical protein [candidate division WWE3 bacterium]
MKNWKVYLALLFMMLMSFACSPPLHDIGAPPELLTNDLESGALQFRHEFDGECFAIITEYSTDYSTKDWHITDSKTLLIRAWVDYEPGCQATTPAVYMEHMHADVNMQATKPIIDGWTQDSMDDW